MSKKPSNRDKLDRILELMQTDDAPPAEDTLLYQLLYAAVARFGVFLPEQTTGVIATMQVPTLDRDPNHTLTWTELDNGTILIQIVAPPEGGSTVSSESAGSPEGTVKDVSGETFPPTTGESDHIAEQPSGSAGEVNQEGPLADAAATADVTPAPAEKSTAKSHGKRGPAASLNSGGRGDSTPTHIGVATSEQLALPLDPVAELEAIEDVEMAEMIEESRK